MLPVPIKILAEKQEFQPIHMLESLGLTPSQIAILGTITLGLSKIPGVAAIVLGGSYARGTARSDSDTDVGLYYSEKSPPEIPAIRQCADPEKTGRLLETNSGNAHDAARNPPRVEIRHS
jgi:predicted nucleotidyltransferase